jgi:hypothetical protein
MRRNNFLIGALVALVTFISLSVFIGHGRWGWQRGGRYNNCYYDQREYKNDWRYNREHDRRQPSTDTSEIR